MRALLAYLPQIRSRRLALRDHLRSARHPVVLGPRLLRARQPRRQAEHRARPGPAAVDGDPARGADGLDASLCAQLPRRARLGPRESRRGCVGPRWRRKPDAGPQSSRRSAIRSRRKDGRRTHRYPARYDATPSLGSAASALLNLSDPSHLNQLVNQCTALARLCVGGRLAGRACDGR